jgi:hypothetical protein
MNSGFFQFLTSHFRLGRKCIFKAKRSPDHLGATESYWPRCAGAIYAILTGTRVIRQILEPAAGGWIVMGAGVDHRVGDVVARQMRVVGVAVEGELQNSHAGQVELVAERIHVRCDLIPKSSAMNGSEPNSR